MALHIRNKEAVIKALREKLNRVLGRRPRRRLVDDLEEIAERCVRLPVLDRKSADEILGFDA